MTKGTTPSEEGVATMPPSKERLFESLRRIAHMKGLVGLLQWDSQVMMPAGAAGARAKQQSILAGILHDMETSNEMDSLIKEVESLGGDTSTLNEWEAASVRDARRDWDRSTRIPKKMAEDEANLKQRAAVAWAKARKDNDYASYAPFIREWVDLLKEKAALTRVDPDTPVYDVLLDHFERGFTSSRVAEIFDVLRREIPPLIRRVQKAKAAVPGGGGGGGGDGGGGDKGGFVLPSRAAFEGTQFAVENQESACNEIAVALGFDMKCGRLDRSLHPFTSLSHPTDVRMTTRYNIDNPFEALTGTIHESGHAIYEQNRPSRVEDQLDLPVSNALSFGIHESQSILMERMVGLSKPFWSHFYAKSILPRFPSLGDGGVDADAFFRAINLVEPGFIRVDADELTYPLHVILRWEIEVELFAGRVDVDDLPAMWNRKVKEYLDLDVTSDSDGILQDMHWAWGYFAYFPTYVLGAAYAAQFYRAACDQVDGLEDSISRGDISPLLAWLKENVHSKGSLHTSGDELCRLATGRPLDPMVYVNYLKEKYSALYGLDIEEEAAPQAAPVPK